MTNVHEAISKTNKPSLKEIDTDRFTSATYKYLCHLEECKQWMEKMIGREYIDIKDFETQLTKGIDLCLLALKFSPDSVSYIYYGKKEGSSRASTLTNRNENKGKDLINTENTDPFKSNISTKFNKINAGINNQTKDNLGEKGLTSAEKDYKYTENINFFLNALRTIKVPEYFLFETFSLYNGSNIPSVIYCIHALSHFLRFKGHNFPGISTLYGMEFSKALMDEKLAELKEVESNTRVKIPEFRNIKTVLHKDFLKDLFMRIKYLCHHKLKKEKHAKEERARQMLEEQMHLSEKNRARQDNEYRDRIVKDRLLAHICEVLSHKADDTLLASLKTYLYRNAFLELTERRKISLFTIKFYLFIFYDSNNEIRKENEIERVVSDCNILRNENYEIEKYNDELEMRVSLLLNNKINASNISVIKPRLEDIMDANFSHDTEDYNFVFNVMQTEPEWMCFLFERVKCINEFVLTNAINLFSNERAEEKYLLSLIGCAFGRLGNKVNKAHKDEEEVFDTYEFVDNHALFIGLRTLMNVYFKGLHSVFKDSLINNIKNLEGFEFENDPSKIYKNIYDVDIGREEALKNETVSKIYLTRLKTLRGVIDGIIDLLFKHIEDFSACIRLFMQKLRNFGFCEQRLLLIFFKEFLYPFVIGPDAYSDFKVTHDTRDKLKMVVKGFECAINGESVYSLRPLDRFFKESKQKLVQFINTFTTFEETYDYGYIFNVKPCVIFTGKQANDFTQTIYNALTEFDHHQSGFETHNEGELCDNFFPQSDKSISEKFDGRIRDVTDSQNKRSIKSDESSGDEKYNVTENYNYEKSINSEKVLKNQKSKKGENLSLPFLRQITAILSSRQPLPDTDKPINFYLNKPVTEDRAQTEQDLFIKGLKMKIIELLRIANGRNLLDVIIRESSAEEEKQYQHRITDLRNKALEQEMNNSSTESLMFLNTGNLYDIFLINNEIRFLTLNDFKESIYDDMQELEKQRSVKRENHYIDMLFQLAEDILRVKYMSKERNRCLDIHKRNLLGLRERKDEIKTLMQDMEQYLTSYIKTTFLNKGNVKNKECAYGSFMAPGSYLLKKGILVEMHRNTEDSIADSNECIKDLQFVFMCEEPGIVLVDILMHSLPVSTFSFRFDELLKYKFRRVDNFIIDDICTFNVEKLTDLLNKQYIK